MRNLLKNIFVLLTCSNLWAQDPQFSQFYNTALSINPAYTGTADCYRAGMVGRTQWIGLQSAFNTSLLYADFNYYDINSGIGLMAQYDQLGVAKLSSVDLSGLYSYTVPMGLYNLKLGLQATYTTRSVDYSRILFEDQFNASTLDVIKGITDDPIREFTSVNYFDFSSGLLFYKYNKYWVGFSTHHLNRPQQGFYLDNSRLPMKFSLELGYKYEYHIKSMTDLDVILVYPCFLYRSQVKFDQADYGVYAYYNNLMMGLFYRGIYFKKFEDERNKDAVTIHVGYNYRQWQFFYSYDFTLNNIKIKNTWGSHEIALVHKFCLDWPHMKKVHRSSMSTPCPDFQQSVSSKKRTVRRHKDLHKQYRGIGF